MTAADLALTRASIMNHEALSLKLAPDDNGTWQIGYGRNLNTDGITIAEANLLLDNDMATRQIQLAQAWAPFATCPGPVQRVLLEMSYQEGVDGLLGFTEMLHAIVAKDYITAAAEALNSHLATETPSRAQFYAATLRSANVLSNPA